MRKVREGHAWIKDAKDISAEIGFTWDSPIWTELQPGGPKQLKGVNRTPRVLNLLNVCFAYAVKKEMPLDELFVDYHVSLPRAISMLGKPRCLTRGAELYDYSRDRAWCAEEHGALMNFYQPCIAGDVEAVSEHFDDTTLKGLYSNSMNIAQMALIMGALLANPDLGIFVEVNHKEGSLLSRNFCLFVEAYCPVSLFVEAYSWKLLIPHKLYGIPYTVYSPYLFVEVCTCPFLKRRMRRRWTRMVRRRLTAERSTATCFARHAQELRRCCTDALGGKHAERGVRSAGFLHIVESWHMPMACGTVDGIDRAIVYD